MKRVKTIPVLDSSDGTTIYVDGAVVVYTKSFKVAFGDSFGLGYIAANTPDLLIEFQGSHKEPATEGAADTHYAEPATMSNVETNLTTTAYKLAEISPATCEYGRFKITGNAANNSTGTGSYIQMWMMIQEDY
jgi:hypothetical protein